MKTIDILTELIAIQSESGHEQAIADHIASWLKKNTHHVVSRQGDNVLVFVKGARSDKCLIFNGHIDTVKIGEVSRWHTDPLKLTEENNRLYGLGTSDMKGADAAMLEMLHRLNDSRPACDMYCMFVTEEETTGNGTNDTLTFLKPKLTDYKEVAAVVGESTRLGVVLGHRGNAFVKVTFSGQGGHASRPPQRAEQATHKAQLFIASIADTQAAWSSAYSDDLLGGPSVTVTALDAGTGAMNQIPTTATVTLDIRTIPSFHTQLVPEVQKWSSAFGGQPEILYPCPAGYCAPDESIAVIAMQLANQQDVVVTQGATDQQFFTQAGIPAIICGPGDKTVIHSPNEHIEKELLQQCTQRYLEIISRWAEYTT